MTVTVVMPAWNEAEGITEFLLELQSALVDYAPLLIVVDDCSTDDTFDVLTRLSAADPAIKVFRNAVNSGHGKSTLAAMQYGLQTGCPVVVTVDGDGQFRGSDVARLVATLHEQHADVVEGVRTHRNDPLYRRTVSLFTRTLVWSRARTWPRDANTPLRVYRAPVLASALDTVPADAMTPNLLISVWARRTGLTVIEVPVESLPRRGSDEQGSTWGTKRKELPSRRFIHFCVQATRQWLATSHPAR